MIGTTLVLADGRRLGYAENGDPNGNPVMLFHGIPGSRLYRHPDDSLTARLGVRLISVDRPGYGLSDFLPDRRLTDWPADVVQLADALRLDRFGVVGHSGGGPYVLACAHAVPRRLTGASVVAGAGPFDVPGVKVGMNWINHFGTGLAWRVPWVAWRALVALWYRGGSRNPASVFDRGSGKRVSADARVLSDPQVRAVCLASYAEGLRPGTLGHAWEVRVIAGDWGFRLQDIAMRVCLWHGTADHDVPLAMAEYVARTLPDCRATFCPGEGHSLLFDHWPEVLGAAMGG